MNFKFKYDNVGLIKEVKINKDILEKVKTGHTEIINITNDVLLEIIKIEKEIKEIQENIKALESEKEGFKALLTRGNAGLGVKLAENTAKINLLKQELILKEETLKQLQALEGEQLENLLDASFNEFIKTGELQGEFIENQNNLILKLYSHLYHAFETVDQLQQLEKEYYNTCDDIYNQDKLRKDFIYLFGTNTAIAQAYNNFPKVGNHTNTIKGEKGILPYIEGIKEAPKNKSVFTMYK